MKKSFLLLIILFSISCSRNNPSIDGLPVIDVTKNYPVKEIALTDIADITYVHLDTKRDEFLYKGDIVYVTENTFVVKDASTNSILFFSKDGAPKSCFNHYGIGPQDYWGIGNPIVYDEATDEVFIQIRSKIQVYSSKGDYKRSLPFPYGVLHQMDSFDDQSLIVYDIGRRFYKEHPKTPEENMDYLTHTIDSSFFLVSKVDGQVTDYIQMTLSHIQLSLKTQSGGLIGSILTEIVKHAAGFLLCNPETDTVFLYTKKKELIPLICKTPPVGNMDPKMILNNCIDSEQYQFMEVQTMSYEKIGRKDYNKYYIRDKKTGEIFQQKIVLPDYKGKRIIISPDLNNFFHENGTCFQLDLTELKLADREKRLSGKLKELVDTLNEFEDNNVFMFVKFK